MANLPSKPLSSPSMLLPSKARGALDDPARAVAADRVDHLREVAP
ncbi:MAG: hypothetical protein ACK5O2_11740 [Microthrixaceae bacterium]